MVRQSKAPKQDHSRVLTDDGQINISQSKVKTWLTCRRAYHNKFVLGLQKKKRSRPLVFGTVMHEIAEAQLEGQDWEKVLNKIDLKNKQLFRKEVEMYGNLIEDMRDIMKDYFEHWGDQVKPIKGSDGRRSEHEFRIELDKGLWFTGKIDAVVKAKGLKWLMEHKTFSRLPSEGERWHSVQAAVYFRAAEEMGFPRLDGVLWDYVSSKPCNVPGELTATGKISQARIDSLPTRIKRWLKDEGHDKKKFAKMLADTKTNRSNRFIRLYAPVKPRIVDNIWEGFVDTAHEIQEFHGKKKVQSIGRHCTWCDFSPLCKAEATGADVDWLIEREYQQEDLSHKRDDKDRSED